MKIKTLSAVSALLALAATLTSAAPSGTAFTYQGKLAIGTGTADGFYDFSFKLYDDASTGTQKGPTLVTNAVPVDHGYFAVTLDFGNQFPGDARWLEISVKTNGGGSLTALVPRQPLTPAPYAVFSTGAGTAQSATVASSATVAGGVTPGAVGAAGIASGQVVKSLNALRDDVTLLPGANLTLTPAGQTLSLSTPDDWHLAGNVATTPGTHFLGTTDNQPLEFKVNGVRALRLEPNPSGPNILGGGTGNSIGSYYGFIGGGNNNQIQYGAYHSVIGGGAGNVIQSNATLSVIAGGYGNQVQGTNGLAALQGVIGGGYMNILEPYGYNSVISGGSGNRIQFDSDSAAIGGGVYNLIGSNADYSIIAGGYGNVISNYAAYAMIPGGLNNVAGESYSFAAGYGARAIHRGSFVWADAVGTAFSATADNQFLIRAGGNVGINKNNPATTLDVNGVVTATGFAGDGSSLTGLGNGSLASDVASLLKVSGGRMGVAGPRVYLPSVAAIDTSTFTGLGFQYNSAYGEGAIMSSFDDGYAYLSFYTKPSTGSPLTKQMIIDRFGGVAIDQSNSNTGKLDHASQNGAGLAFGVGSGEGIASKRNSGGNQYGLDFYTGFQPRLSIDTAGRVGIGTTSINDATLDVRGDIRLTDCQLLLRGDRNHGLVYRDSASGISFDGPFLYGYGGGALGTVGPDEVSLKWDWQGNVWISNECSVATLRIRGGADLAEPFDVTSSRQVPEGSVVIIDEQNPGRLKLSDQPYDTRVAGVVSGANGVNPGIQMMQQGTIEGSKNVALTGRVYVQADTSNGPIRPGDLLTTSSNPGHAMKVTDHTRAQGAILGKAMSPLAKDDGLVLVLVTLQ